MKDFLSSPDFLVWAVCLTLAFGVIAVLRKNIHWVARGVTGAATLTRLRSGIRGLLPSSLLNRFLLFGGVTIVFIFWMFGVMPTPSEWNGDWKSPSLRTVTDFAWKHWLPLLISWGILSGLVAVASNTNAIEKSAAATFYKVSTWMMLILFLGFPGFFWVKDGLASAVVCSKASANEERVCVLKNTKETAPIMPEANNMKFCIGPDKVFNDGTVKFKRTPVGDGRFYLQFQLTKSGVEMPVTYKLFPASKKCPPTP